MANIILWNSKKSREATACREIGPELGAIPMACDGGVVTLCLVLYSGLLTHDHAVTRDQRAYWLGRCMTLESRTAARYFIATISWEQQYEFVFFSLPNISHFHHRPPDHAITTPAVRAAREYS